MGDQAFCQFSNDPTFQESLESELSDFFLENTIPKIINIMPIPIDVLLFDEPNNPGNKKSTPASIQSAGAYLRNIGSFIFFTQIRLLTE